MEEIESTRSEESLSCVPTLLWLTKCNVAKFNGSELKAFRR